MLSESLLEGLQTINSCSGDDVSMLRYSSDVGSEEACRMDITILHASSKVATYGDILESQCSVYDSKMHYDKVEENVRGCDDDKPSSVPLY